MKTTCRLFRAMTQARIGDRGWNPIDTAIFITFGSFVVFGFPLAVLMAIIAVLIGNPQWFQTVFGIVLFGMPIGLGIWAFIDQTVEHLKMDSFK